MAANVRIGHIVTELWRTHSRVPCRHSCRHLWSSHQASPRVWTRHARVRAPHGQAGRPVLPGGDAEVVEIGDAVGAGPEADVAGTGEGGIRCFQDTAVV